MQDDTTIGETEYEFGASPEEMLDALKRKADLLGVKYGPRIGLDTLRAKINAHTEGGPVPEGNSRRG